AIEEMLRHHPPVLSFRRTASTDVDLAGQRVAVGDKVVVFHCSANFDDRVFADPMRFDITRAPNPHVSFGDGPHVCVGAHFARLQLRALYQQVVWRLPDLESAGDVSHLVSNFINGITHLPVHFTPTGQRRP
ncbi:MAG TPA: cytochrome P450, partial [Mycobacteriales bacterium]